MIQTRTTGFFDKEPVNYADAIMHGINVGASHRDEWDPALLHNLQKLQELRSKMQESRNQTGSDETEYDQWYLEAAHWFERYNQTHGRDIHFGMQSLAAFMRLHQDIITKEISGFTWDKKDLNIHQQMMLVYWSLLGSDGLAPTYVNRPFPPHFNPETDSFADPVLTIPHVIDAYRQKIPAITTQDYWSDNQSLEHTLAHSPIPETYKYIPFVTRLSQLG